MSFRSEVGDTSPASNEPHLIDGDSGFGFDTINPPISASLQICLRSH